MYDLAICFLNEATFQFPNIQKGGCSSVDLTPEITYNE